MKKGRLKQCVTSGVFVRGTSLEDGCKLAASLGIVGYDLKGPADWPTLKKYGLTPTMYLRDRAAASPTRSIAWTCTRSWNR